jgi:hypothetical protein
MTQTKGFAKGCMEQQKCLFFFFKFFRCKKTATVQFLLLLDRSLTMAGTSKKQEPEARGNINIFSDPVVWSEQAEELYLKSLPRPEQPPGNGNDDIVGDTKHSASSSIFSYNNSMSSFSDISNSIKTASGYPDSYGEGFVLENGMTCSQLFMTPERTSRSQREEEAKKEAILTLTPKTQASDGKEIHLWDEDLRCCGLFRRAFEEENMFRRLVHSAVCLLIVFAMLAVFIILRSQLYGVEGENTAAASGPLPNVPQPTMVRPAPSATFPPTKPTSDPTVHPLIQTAVPTMIAPTVSPNPNATTEPSSGPTVDPLIQTAVPTMIAPTFSPTLNVEREEIKNLILNASPESLELLEDSSSAQSKALAWMSSPQSTDTFFSEEKLIQRWALAVFYYSTAGENWYNTDNWLTNVDECEWYTAHDEEPVCNAEGRMYSLHLRDNNLDGTLPTELTLLSNSLGKSMR